MGRLFEHMKTLVKLDAFALGIMHVSNSFITSVASGKNMLKPGGGKYMRWKYGYVFYHKYGEGSPVVLLHHLHPAFSSYEWNEVIDDLSKDHTVYTVDLPGCGRSSKNRISYTNYFYVLFLTSFIKEVVRKKCTVIASGYSSSFAIMTATVDESLIGRIIAVNPYSIQRLMKSPTRKAKIASRLISLPVIGTSVYNMIQSRENINLSFTEEYMYNPFRSKSRYVDAFYEGAHFNEGKGKFLLASIQGNMMSVNLVNALRNMGDKLFILYGEKVDNIHTIVSTYEKYDPEIRSQCIASAGLIPHMERSSAFMEAYENVLQM